MDEHLKALQQVMEAIFESGLPLNSSKCVFGANEIKFWGAIFSAEGINPDPEKVEALENQNKDELKSFLCMMQSNSDFIPHFSKLASTLRELLKTKTRYKQKSVQQKALEKLMNTFEEDTSLRYFDLNKQTYIFTDGH